MRTIFNLEIHVAHTCNLTCESCSHYSNQLHKGLVPLEEAERWMASWDRRIAPELFSLVGGEPTVHPDLCDFIVLARRHWPGATLRIVTNGFLLHRHPRLPLVLKADPKAELYLSIHHDSPDYREKIRPAVELVQDWVAAHGIQVGYYDSYDSWTRRYKGAGSEMQPYEDRKPKRSWQHCPSKFAPQLFEDKIWKCPALAYLGMQDRKYHLSEKWRRYLEYRPLSPDCTDEELEEFFDRKEEIYCGMCPAKPEKLKLPIPDAALRRAVEARQALAPPAPAPAKARFLDRFRR